MCWPPLLRPAPRLYRWGLFFNPLSVTLPLNQSGAAWVIDLVVMKPPLPPSSLSLSLSLYPFYFPVQESLAAFGGFKRNTASLICLPSPGASGKPAGWSLTLSDSLPLYIRSFSFYLSCSLSLRQGLCPSVLLNHLDPFHNSSYLSDTLYPAWPHFQQEGGECHCHIKVSNLHPWNCFMEKSLQSTGVLL